MKIKQFFVPATVADPEEARTVHLLNTLLVSLEIAAIIYTLVLWATRQSAQRFYLVGGAGLLLLSIHILLRQRKTRLAGLVLVWGLWLLITASVLLLDGIHFPTFYAYTIPILLAGLLIERWAGIAFAASSALVGLVIVWHSGQADRMAFDALLGSPLLSWVIVSLTFGIAAILQYAEVSSLRTALAQARVHERALAERNLTLQARTRELEQSASALRQSEVHQSEERLRALNTRLAKMEENERKRLARELHDGVAQNLTGLNLNLNVLQRHMLTEVATDSRVHPRLKDAITLVEQATMQIRTIMADLRPPVLDDYGLLATLQWYAAQLVLDTGLPVEVLGEVLTPRPAEYVELTLFRIVQEALTNSVKHAQATQAIVVLTADNTTIYVSINDDGMGFDATCCEHSTQQQGWGLITMRERAEAIGGHCHIESYPFLGTSVMVEVQR